MKKVWKMPCWTTRTRAKQISGELKIRSWSLKQYTKDSHYEVERNVIRIKITFQFNYLLQKDESEFAQDQYSSSIGNFFEGQILVVCPRFVANWPTYDQFLRSVFTLITVERFTLMFYIWIIRSYLKIRNTFLFTFH